MDTLGETSVIVGIVRAGDDALVRLALPMKAFEIGMVVGQHGTLVGRGVDENLPARPASWPVNTSCPKRRSSWTTGRGKSSSA
jgi:hypothetical protein